MAKRRAQSRAPRGKNPREERAERITWALLVLVFAVIQFLPASQQTGISTVFVPFAGAIILIGSGFYQYSQGWRVSPITWIAGMLMAGLAFYGLRVDASIDMLAPSLIVFAGVILAGVITGET
jgi:hypothetical protein